MFTPDSAQLISLLMSLILVASGYVYMRRDPKRELKNFLIWIMLFAALIIGYMVLENGLSGSRPASNKPLMQQDI